MSRLLFPAIIAVLITPAHAVIDTNSNGLSDLWEKAYNADTLFSPTNPDHNPEEDPDGDGWTNLVESTAGTNPFSADTTTGLVSPQIAVTLGIYDEDAAAAGAPPVLIEPPRTTLTWHTVVGKAYRVEFSEDLAIWAPASDEFMGTGIPLTFESENLHSDGSVPTELFARISISDADSDGDTLTDWEEGILETNPFFPDTDRDSIPDNLDTDPRVSATLADPDGLGLANAGLLLGLKANWSFEEGTIPLANLFGKNEARCENYAPGATSAWPVLVPFGMHGTSAFERRGFVSQGLPIADKSIYGDGKVFTGITNSFTLSFWHRFQKDSIKNGSAIYKCLWSLSDCRPTHSSIKSNTLAIRRKSATEEEIYLGAYVWNSAGGVADSTLLGKSFTRPLGTADDGNWHQYTIVRSAGKNTLLIDGQPMPALNNQTVGWLEIPLNKPTPTLVTDFNYDWNTFGRMAPTLAHNQTLGTFDRIRLWSRALSLAETTALHREDLDKDGLWDVTEETTSYWIDYNSDGIATESEIYHHASPWLWQKSDHDTDRDGATDLEEQTAETILWNPDTDADLIPDGWEMDVSMNPRNDSDANLDPDQDGATNLQEYRHNSNPNVSNTDGDSKSDGEEINGPDGNPDTDDGSDPADPSDNGVRPPNDQLVFFKLGVGDRSSSHSEDYVLNVFRYTENTALETRVYTLRSGGFGEYKELTRGFRKDHLYTFQIQWLGSSRNIKPSNTGTAAQKPDYDYHMVVEPLQGTTGFVADSFDPNARTHNPALRLLDPEDIQPSDDDDDNVIDLPHTLSPLRALFVPVIFERDIDVPDGSWQPMTGQLATALPGQKLNLSVRTPLLPKRLKMSNYEWILPTIHFKDYKASVTTATLYQMEPADIHKNEIGFYFASTGQKSVKLKINLDGALKETSTTINIQKPTVTYTRTTGLIRFTQPGDLSPGFYAGFYAVPGVIGGHGSQTKVEVPVGWPQGRWHWVQVGTSVRTLTELNGSYKTKTLNGIHGLDTSYPYSPKAPASTPNIIASHTTGAKQEVMSDSPALLLSGYLARTADDDFTIYVMFLPDGVESRYVPLKKLRWGWDAEVSKDNSGWHITNSSFYSENPEDTSSHPIWSVNLKDGVYE